MDVIEIAPYAEVIGEVSVMRASSGPNADVSDRKQVRGMSDVVDGQALTAGVLLRGRNSEVGDGFHGLSMESGFQYFI